MKINVYLESLRMKNFDEPVSIIRITNTTSNPLPVSFEPWAYTKVVEPDLWIDVLISGHKSIALDVHYLPDEIIAYTETGTTLKLFDHSGEYLDTGWGDKLFPDPNNYAKT